MKPTAKVHELGQSLWLDNITRDLPRSSGTVGVGGSRAREGELSEVHDPALCVFAPYGAKAAQHIRRLLTYAPARRGWFAARPSRTEHSYKIYAESFVDQAHLDTIVAEARAIVDRAVGFSA